MTQRQLTEAEQAELDALNAAVTSAKEARRDWLDRKMHETSHLQVGDSIYDLRTGERLGTVRKLYRYDKSSVYCDYEYETAPRCFDNTSSQPGRSFGTRADAASSAVLELAARFITGF